MSMNILMIEDDEDRHAAIRGYLEGRSYRVTACWSTAEADKVLAGIVDGASAPDAIVAGADGVVFYMKARDRFPGLSWILTAPRPELPALANPLTASIGLTVGTSADGVSSLTGKV